MNAQKEIATLAGGCFWCTEAIFKRLHGVYSAIPGYSGGKTKNPSYENVSMGNTGHAESIQIKFDPREIPFTALLDIFWHIHNPTTLNQQGNDIGTQYRSAIFYHSKKQKQQALDSKKKIENEKLFNNPIVTQILPFKTFYKAEEYHRDYYDQNKDYPYCTFVISPKIKKLQEKYLNRIKNEYKKEI